MNGAMARFSGKTLLIADDDSLFREVLRDLFEAEGARVLEASGGREALGLIRDHSVDAVISDLQMPGGNGLELLREFRRNRTDTPFVLFLTHNLEIQKADALGLGADLVLSKPFEFSELAEALLGRM
jgi:CheY-like chemotaxis protein